jgi:hypothetical protein
MNKIYRFILFAVLLFATSTYAQFTISGVVTEASTGDKLIGGNVYIPELALGAATDANGEYSITVDAGTYKLTCSYIGFDKIEQEVTVNADVTLNFSMVEYQFTLSVTVMSDRVKERETPVAFTNFDKKDMELNLGSQDIPLVMNTAPSVYATGQGGGAGDARFNVRGFNQRNVGVMINGIPQNDMENGWVYWSNWDGVGDATSSIQLQRGLSATTLTTPSIGGTMNIITDPAQHKAGAYFKNEIGTGGFHKQTVFGNTGLVDGKFAMSFGGIRKVGDGHADKTWTDAWAYYLGMAYEINANNRLELYAMGAPQRHGQRRWKLNTAEFSHDLARDLGYTEALLNEHRLREKGLLYNSNVHGISPAYYGKQWERSYWNSNLNSRRDPGYLNESQNYFHKPLVNLNWYSKFSDKFSLYTTAYWSGGRGGGTGTYGSLNYDYSSLQRVVDWNSTINENYGHITFADPYGTGDSSYYAISTDQRNKPYDRSGILRNSVNQQYTIGAISKAYLKVNKEFTASFGVDWRTAEIDHYREVRDLLGNDFWVSYDNEFAPDGEFRRLGDKIDYNNTNTVNWLGGYVQGEYTKDKYTFYATAGYSMVKYDYTDHFRMDPTTGSEVNLKVDWTSGYQFKGGASLRASDQVHLYVNGGYVSKVPRFDQVISDFNATLVENPENETFLSFEAGVNSSVLQNRLNLSANAYFTDWTDRIDNIRVDNADGTDGLVRLFGVSSRHMGVELAGDYQPHKFIRFNAAFSYGIWEYTDDATAVYIASFATDSTHDLNASIKDLKVGDAPQTQLALGLTIFPVPGMQIQLLWRYYDNYYADFDPFSRSYFDPSTVSSADSIALVEDVGVLPAPDREKGWQIPAYNLFELHFAYNVPGQVLGMDVTVFAHVFNLFNELYVQDATDNSQYNAWTGDADPNDPNDNGKNHEANDAEIYPGLPTSFNAGFSVAL